MAETEWKIVQIVVSIRRPDWVPDENWDWKKPFRKLKCATIKAGTEWQILLEVEEDYVKKVYNICDSRHHVETIMELEEEKS